MFNFFFLITRNPQTTGLFGFPNRLWLFCKHCKICSNQFLLSTRAFFASSKINNPPIFQIHPFLTLFFTEKYRFRNFFTANVFPYRLSRASLSLTSGCLHTDYSSHFSPAARNQSTTQNGYPMATDDDDVDDLSRWVTSKISSFFFECKDFKFSPHLDNASRACYVQPSRERLNKRSHVWK